MKAQQYLTHENATKLSHPTELETPKNVVISKDTWDFKFLEGISEGDYVVDPHASFSRREQKRLHRIVSAHRNIDEGIIFPFGFFGFVALLTGVVFMCFPEDMPFPISLILTIASASFLAGISSSPFLIKKTLNKALKKHGFLKFPKLGHRELSNSSLTHEQIYEIASLGEDRAEIDREMESIGTRLTDLGEQMKSSRVLNDIAQLEARWSFLSEELNELTERISAIITGRADDDKVVP